MPDASTFLALVDAKILANHSVERASGCSLSRCLDRLEFFGRHVPKQEVAIVSRQRMPSEAVRLALVLYHGLRHNPPRNSRGACSPPWSSRRDTRDRRSVSCPSSKDLRHRTTERRDLPQPPTVCSRCTATDTLGSVGSSRVAVASIVCPAVAGTGAYRIDYSM